MICISTTGSIVVFLARTAASQDNLLNLQVVFICVVHNLLSIFPFQFFCLLGVGLDFFLLLRYPLFQHLFLLLESAGTKFFLIELDLQLLLSSFFLVFNSFDPQFLQFWKVDIVFRFQVTDFKLFLKCVSVKDRCRPRTARLLLQLILGITDCLVGMTALLS